MMSFTDLKISLIAHNYLEYFQQDIYVSSPHLSRQIARHDEKNQTNCQYQRQNDCRKYQNENQFLNNNYHCYNFYSLSEL